MTPSNEPALIVEARDRVLIIEINRPSQRNAITRDLAKGIADAISRLDDDPGLSVGIISGRGGTFSAGMDLKRFAEGERATVGHRGFAGLVQAPPAKPLIAAVEGWALGGGFEMVLACDLVVAARSARFGLPEVRRGLLARGGGMFRLPRRIPRAIALEVLLTGDPLSADRAAAFGLVNELVDDGLALDAAVSLAERIAANAPLSLQATKRIAVESADWDLGAAFDLQSELSDTVFASADAMEGAIAFAEKRAPEWTGR
ncbi:crotonase/enoyl-CoA hydratase family protein [Microbacterium sp. NPDC055357]